ncbi:response regulator [Nakamurella sp. YIM 132087]|uniref:Response regulator n=1 Tax=Nakamurella alba TaxID=2665158 RepID=A0A7K1FLP3_9ACTN|nr:response regulator transcription factor [Nakamurella alba]MTD15028.1 response regulator [Nakamurella alba]
MDQEHEDVRCLVVDDSAAFRDAVRTMLARDGISVIGTADCGDDALARYAELAPDLVLVDVDLGAESGFDVVLRLQAAGAAMDRVVLTSTHAEVDLAELVEQSPARGFLPKFALSGSRLRALVGD